jgi:hypothetical protein
MKFPIFLYLPVFAVFLLSANAPGQGCSPPPVVANVRPANIFSPEQEMILGELSLQSRSSDMPFIEDQSLLEYVTAIGERLVKHLPPTGLTYHFHLVDIPEANAFNTPGGHVFITRKLIAFVKNEDELAAVIAHELGHATVHHAATDLSIRLKKILDVSSVTDRKDIAEKYNLLIENARTKSVTVNASHTDEKQLEADRIGLFALVAAGYDATAFSNFFDRLTESKGKTGSWFSDLFGKTTPDQKRLREMAHLTDKLPAACREGRSAKLSDEFLNWQADVISYRTPNRTESLPGLIWKKDITPKLRSDISRIVVSMDGRYLITRDDFSVTVLERDPLKVLFQIPAEGVADLYITPDSQYVVFDTEGLRFEKWSITERKPLVVRELVLRRDCIANRLSPDGKFLACIDTSLTAKIIDTNNGNVLFEKKKFYELNYYEYIVWYYDTYFSD